MNESSRRQIFFHMNVNPFSLLMTFTLEFSFLSLVSRESGGMERCSKACCVVRCRASI